MPVVRHHLRCLDCEALAPASLDLACERCGGLYEIDYPRLAEGGIRLPLTALPLGQGNTPTISFDWPDALRLRLELKLEFLSPTGSFKDRGAAMLVSAAWSGGASAFVEDSSGNAGAALAAYAAAARMSAEIFVPTDAPETKKAQISAVGGKIHAIDGDREAVAQAAEHYAQEQGIPYLSHNRSPYFSEGMKSAAEEIADHGLPDAIVLPVGNGSLLIGLHRGFRELVQLERIERMPRLYAIQATNVSPLASAFRNHESQRPRSRPWPTASPSRNRRVWRRCWMPCARAEAPPAWSRSWRSTWRGQRSRSAACSSSRPRPSRWPRSGVCWNAACSSKMSACWCL